MRNLLATAAEESPGSGQTPEHIRQDRHRLWPTFLTSSHADEGRTCISVPLERKHAFMNIHVSNMPFKLFTLNPNQTPLTVNLPPSANIFIKEHFIRFLPMLNHEVEKKKLHKGNYMNSTSYQLLIHTPTSLCCTLLCWCYLCIDINAVHLWLKMLIDCNFLHVWDVSACSTPHFMLLD